MTQGELSGRTAVVTGGSRGVGRAVALALAHKGAAVAVNYRRDQDSAADVVAQIIAAGGTARAYQAEIGDAAKIQAMVEEIRHDLGPIDIVISNAGISSRGHDVADTPHTEFESLMKVHTWGPIQLIQALLPDLRQAERGDIVMISSAAVATAPAGAAAYTMAKAAMETCVATLAREERRNGIRANIVAPGLVSTDMGRRLVNAAAGHDIQDLNSSAPFGRVCTPDDVAGAVNWLVSSDASYVSGQKIGVDGGGPEASVF
ncbi:oxidoreductase [Rhodococcus sp. RS1C4]|nr:SDR family oxidoreductase [Rhodococcus sp. RS1C4]OZC42685.1 oxidoreductase [Rhodococcus sp. RS1C4]